MNGSGTQADALLSRCRRLLHGHQARAKAAGQVLNYNLDDLRRLIESSPCCHWCRRPQAFDLQLDHLHPTSRGGPWTLDNLCVSCGRCNRLRGMLTEAETVALLAFLAGLHPVARQDIERRLLHGGKRYAGKRAEHGRAGAKRAAAVTPGGRVEMARAEVELLKARLEKGDHS
jgi:hypothetical protein